MKRRHEGLARVWHATLNSFAGLQAALRHEVSFRQEAAFGLPLVCAAPWLAPGRWAVLLALLLAAATWAVALWP